MDSVTLQQYNPSYQNHKLKISVGSKKRMVSQTTQSIVVEINSNLNVVIDRLTIHMFKVIPSSFYQYMRYPVNRQQVASRKSY